MVMIESRHEGYQLEAVVPMGLAEELFGFCELSGADLDKFVSDAIRRKLKGGAR